MCSHQSICHQATRVAGAVVDGGLRGTATEAAREGLGYVVAAAEAEERRALVMAVESLEEEASAATALREGAEMAGRAAASPVVAAAVRREGSCCQHGINRVGHPRNTGVVGALAHENSGASMWARDRWPHNDRPTLHAYLEHPEC